jgi:hypothetical protein
MFLKACCKKTVLNFVCQPVQSSPGVIRYVPLRRSSCVNISGTVSVGFVLTLIPITAKLACPGFYPTNPCKHVRTKVACYRRDELVCLTNLVVVKMFFSRLGTACRAARLGFHRKPSSQSTSMGRSWADSKNISVTGRTRSSLYHLGHSGDVPGTRALHSHAVVACRRRSLQHMRYCGRFSHSCGTLNDVCTVQPQFRFQRVCRLLHQSL